MIRKIKVNIYWKEHVIKWRIKEKMVLIVRKGMVYVGIEDNFDELFMRAFLFNPCLMAISEINSGVYICVNDSFLQTLGYSQAEVVGKSSLDSGIFLDSRDRCNQIEILHEHGRVRNYECYIKCKDGRTIFGEFNVEVVQVQDKPYLLTVFNDLTSKKQLEREVFLLEKWHLIGQLAAGISHEVRNPLTTIKGFLQLLAKKPESAMHLTYYDLMLNEIDRANLIMSEFLSIAKAKPETCTHSKISLDNLVARIEPLITSDALKTGHEIVFQIEQDCFIIANENEIQQIIFNLTRNGFEAMPANGTLTIVICHRDDKVLLAVKDQGTGIEKHVLDNLGTPFVSTKQNGTGLGLAVCHGIAHRHDARIEVDSGSQGTTFSIYFPSAN